MMMRESGKCSVMIDVRTTPPHDVRTAFCDHFLGVLGWLYPVGYPRMGHLRTKATLGYIELLGQELLA